MGRVAAVAGALILVTLITAACSSSPVPAYYLARNASSVLLITWNAPQNGQATGNVTYDSINGNGSDPSAPYSLSVQTDPVTVTINGSAVTFTGFLGASFSGQLGNGQLSITTPPNTSTGQIQTGALNSSDAGAYNSAVTALHKTISHDNARAAQAVQQQQITQQHQQDQQTASQDATSLTDDTSNLSGDVSNLSGDANTAGTDLQTTQSDASQGPGDQCINASTTVYNDAATALYNDQVTTLANDVTTLQQDISTVKQDITTSQSDLQTLQSDGVSAPANASSAASNAQSAISSAVAKANQDISAVNSDVAQGYQIANGLATGACAGQGPGDPPSPEPSISA